MPATSGKPITIFHEQPKFDSSIEISRRWTRTVEPFLADGKIKASVVPQKNETIEKTKQNKNCVTPVGGPHHTFATRCLDMGIQNRWDDKTAHRQGSSATILLCCTRCSFDLTLPTGRDVRVLYVYGMHHAWYHMCLFVPVQ